MTNGDRTKGAPPRGQMTAILRIYRNSCGRWTGRLQFGGTELCLLGAYDTPEGVERAFGKLGLHPDCVEVEAS
ncbi:hypothetical protein AWB81_07477 [Caballeronia arationis]|nr:hypothetical protein AWB81_07477 [Caballeronia arationis]